MRPPIEAIQASTDIIHASIEIFQASTGTIKHLIEHRTRLKYLTVELNALVSDLVPGEYIHSIIATEKTLAEPSSRKASLHPPTTFPNAEAHKKHSYN